MHFRKLVDSRHLAAEDFLDGNFQPVERALTIKSVGLQKPPAGGKEKACIGFVETEKTAFLANGEIKSIARMLRRADTDQWIGAQVTITATDKKFAGQPVKGMSIVSATLAPKAGGATDGAA